MSNPSDKSSPGSGSMDRVVRGRRHRTLYKAWVAVSMHANLLDGIHEDCSRELHAIADKLEVAMDESSNKKLRCCEQEPSSANRKN